MEIVTSWNFCFICSLQNKPIPSVDPADEQQERSLLEFWSNYLIREDGKLGVHVIEDFCTFSVGC